VVPLVTRILPSRCRSYPFILFCLCGVVYFTTSITYAWTQRLWFDELWAYHVVHNNTIAGIWAALCGGVDGHPPLYYVLAALSQRVFGPSIIALRLPSIIGYFVGVICTYIFISRRCGSSYALLGACFLLASGTFGLAYQARPYGLVIGCAAAALLCWQLAADKWRRHLSVPGLFLALSGALLSHCYAALLPLLLLLGEAVRVSTTKQRDVPVVIAIAASWSTAITYLPLVSFEHSLRYDNELMRPTWSSLVGAYEYLIGSPAIELLAIIAFFAIYSTARPPHAHYAPHAIAPCDAAAGQCRFDERSSVPFRFHELVVLIAFSLIPVVSVMVSMIATNVFQNRYAATGILGLSALLSLVACRCGNRNAAVADVVYLLWLTTTILKPVSNYVSPWYGQLMASGVTRDNTLYSGSMRERPIVMSSGFLFIEADHYAPSLVVKRLYFLIDEAAARKYTGTDIFDKKFVSIRTAVPFRAHLEGYTSFVSRYRTFFVMGPLYGPMDWLIPRLRADGAQITLEREDQRRVVSQDQRMALYYVQAR
jgi:hypothetical protein